MARIDGHTLFRYGAVLAFVLCYATILLGGNVMASNSGLGCSSWPSCNGTFFPALTGAQGVEWAHRLAAGTLSIAVFSLAAIAYRAERSRPILQRMSYLAAGLVVTEAGLGGLVVDSRLVVGLVLLHFLIATVLFGLLLLLAAVSNLREIPKRWLDWAERAADGREPEPSGTDAPFGAPGPSVPGPSEHPL